MTDGCYVAAMQPGISFGGGSIFGFFVAKIELNITKMYNFILLYYNIFINNKLTFMNAFINSPLCTVYKDIIVLYKCDFRNIPKITVSGSISADMTTQVCQRKYYY